MEKIYGKHKLVGLQLFLSGTPTFSSGTPTFCQMGVLNSCFQNPSESSVSVCQIDHSLAIFFTMKNQQCANFIRISEEQYRERSVLDLRLKGRGYKPPRHHCVVVLEQDTFILA